MTNAIYRRAGCCHVCMQSSMIAVQAGRILSNLSWLTGQQGWSALCIRARDARPATLLAQLTVNRCHRPPLQVGIHPSAAEELVSMRSRARRIRGRGKEDHDKTNRST